MSFCMKASLTRLGYRPKSPDSLWHRLHYVITVNLFESKMYQGSTDNYQNLFSEHTKRDSDTKSRIRDLEARVDKLELVCESLWNIIKEEKQLKEIDLIELMTQIDLRDGRFDGKKMKTPSIKCPKCGRMNSKRHSKCMYCEEVYLVGPFE